MTLRGRCRKVLPGASSQDELLCLSWGLRTTPPSLPTVSPGGCWPGCLRDRQADCWKFPALWRATIGKGASAGRRVSKVSWPPQPERRAGCGWGQEVGTVLQTALCGPEGVTCRGRPKEETGEEGSCSPKWGLFPQCLGSPGPSPSPDTQVYSLRAKLSCRVPGDGSSNTLIPSL